MTFRITVIKKTINESIRKKYSHENKGACEVFNGGDIFESEGYLEIPEGFCSWAWNDMYKVLLTLEQGGTFQLTREDNTMVVNCTDGVRPVTFLMRVLHFSRF